MLRWRPAGFGSAIGAILVIGVTATAFGQQTLPDEDALARVSLQRRWHTQVPILKTRERIMYVKVQDGLVFASSDQGMVHVLNDETGKLLWSATAGELGTVIYEPTATKQFVYVAGGELLKQFDRVNGRLNWSKRMPAGIVSGPVANEEFVYVPTVDKRIQAIGLSDDFRRTYTQQPIAWFYYVGSPIDNPPVLLKDRVVVGTREGRIYALALDQRNLYFRYYTDSEMSAPIANWDDRLYLASVDSSVYCINLSSGVTRWRYVTGYPIVKMPIPFMNEVYIVSDGAGMFCLSTVDGKPRWLNDRVVGMLAASEKNVYAKDRLGNGLVLAKSDGNILGTFPLAGFELNAKNKWNDRIYVSTRDGLLLCLAEKGRDKPYVHPQKRPSDEPEEEAPKAGQPEKKKGFFDDVLQKGKPSNVGKISKKKGEEEPEEAPKKKEGKAKSFFDDN